MFYAFNGNKPRPWSEASRHYDMAKKRVEKILNRAHGYVYVGSISIAIGVSIEQTENIVMKLLNDGVLMVPDKDERLELGYTQDAFVVKARDKMLSRAFDDVE